MEEATDHRPLNRQSKEQTDDQDQDDFSWIPEKHLLELILDNLQRNDTEEIFTKPADTNEARDYCEIIKEPMDLGTMRAKLHEGRYQTFQQFEARALDTLGKKMLKALRANPAKFEKTYATERRRSGRIIRKEAANVSNSGGLKMEMDTGTTRRRKRVVKKRSNLMLRGNAGERKPHGMAAREESLRGVEKNEEAANHQSVPRATCVESPQMMFHVYEENAISYTESLMLFAHDLGPTAMRVANRKLETCSGEVPKCTDLIHAAAATGNTSNGNPHPTTTILIEAEDEDDDHDDDEEEEDEDEDEDDKEDVNDACKKSKGNDNMSGRTYGANSTRGKEIVGGNIMAGTTSTRRRRRLNNIREMIVALTAKRDRWSHSHLDDQQITLKMPSSSQIMSLAALPAVTESFAYVTVRKESVSPRPDHPHGRPPLPTAKKKDKAQASKIKTDAADHRRGGKFSCKPVEFKKLKTIPSQQMVPTPKTSLSSSNSNVYPENKELFRFGPEYLRSAGFFPRIGIGSATPTRTTSAAIKTASIAAPPAGRTTASPSLNHHSHSHSHRPPFQTVGIAAQVSNKMNKADADDRQGFGFESSELDLNIQLFSSTPSPTEDNFGLQQKQVVQDTNIYMGSTLNPNNNNIRSSMMINIPHWGSEGADNGSSSSGTNLLPFAAGSSSGTNILPFAAGSSSSGTNLLPFAAGSNSGINLLPFAAAATSASLSSTWQKEKEKEKEKEQEQEQEKGKFRFDIDYLRSVAGLDVGNNGGVVGLHEMKNQIIQSQGACGSNYCWPAAAVSYAHVPPSAVPSSAVSPPVAESFSAYRHPCQQQKETGLPPPPPPPPPSPHLSVGIEKYEDSQDWALADLSLGWRRHHLR